MFKPSSATSPAPPSSASSKHSSSTHIPSEMRTPGRPGKPHATKVTQNSLVLSWGKPRYGADSAVVQSYTITYRAKDDPPGRWHTQTTSKLMHAELTNLVAKTIYLFKVRAESATGMSGHYSETSDPIETKCLVRLADKMIPHCKPSQLSSAGLKVYLLPNRVTMKKSSILKVTVGHSQHVPTATHKVLMLVGATVAGRTTMINAMANYIMGVDWEDEYRFKLISEETAHDQTKSHTNCITAYTFHKYEGSPLPYILTVIDTPGFGDTGGLERNKQIVKQIKDFFSIRGDEGIDQLHGIGFVTQAPLARLTPTQRYVFDSILSVFGKDVADNIFLMVTFADGKRPPVLDAVRAAGVPFKSHFKFNNSALFASKETDDEFDKIFWRMGKNSFKDFFDHFSKVKARSLQLSREVLQEREQLEITIQGLQPQIRAGLAKIDDLRQEKQLLNQHEADIIHHQNFTFQVQILKQRKIDLPTGRYTTNCLNCNYTCHYPCPYPSDGDKYKCRAMDNLGFKNATCRVCPGQCPWRNHVNNPYRFEIYQEQETRTIDDFKAKYDSAMSNKGQVEAVMKKMKNELQDMDRTVLQKIKQAKQHLQRLEEIALRPDSLRTEVEYIDILIESELREAHPGWSQRVKALREARKQAEIVADIKSTRGEKDECFFPQSAHEFPCNQPEQQQLGMWGKFKSLWR